MTGPCGEKKSEGWKMCYTKMLFVNIQSKYLTKRALEVLGGYKIGRQSHPEICIYLVLLTKEETVIRA
jgi:hypothetical protein